MRTAISAFSLVVLQVRPQRRRWSPNRIWLKAVYVFDVFTG
jgi:hypothetical protein